MSGVDHAFASLTSSQVMLLLFYEPHFEYQRAREIFLKLEHIQNDLLI